MKKLLLVLVAFSLTFGLAACNGGTSDDEDVLKVVLMVNGTLGDLSFFDSAAEGLQMIEDEYGDAVETKVVEAGFDDSKWEPTLIDLSDSDWDIIIVGTWSMTEILQDVAAEFPEKNYIIFDSVVDYSLGLDNVYSITYKQNEAAFMAGALAAKIVEDGEKIGFMGGMDIPVINDFLVGYIEGAQYVNGSIKVNASYVGDFSDSAKGKEIALNQYSQGVGVSFNVAGGAGLGLLDAAKETDNFAIGVDSDQALIFAETDPEKAALIVTSVLKKVNMSLLRAISMHIDGTITYGEAENLGFAEEAVGLADNVYYRAAVSQVIIDELIEIQSKISNGEIVVSTAFGMTTEQLNAIKQEVE